MNCTIHDAPRIWRGRSFAFVCAALCLPCSIAWAGLAGYRVNLTPSEPIGLWRIVSLARPVVAGDVVFICPPERPDMEQAAQRGYLRSGLCPGGYAPLIKTVVATAGQHVEIKRSVSIDQVPLARSSLVSTDGQGRSLAPYAGGVLGEGLVFLHSDFVGSYDSRYFGPIPVAGILGLAMEVWTLAL
jgi:conjugative transfer signal peptidase TraF